MTTLHPPLPDTEAPTPAQTLRTGRLIADVASAYFGNIGNFFLAMPLALLLLYPVTRFLVMPAAMEAQATGTLSGSGLMLTLSGRVLEYLIGILFAVACHRFVLTGREGRHPLLGIAVGGTELRFLGYALVISIVLGLITGIAAIPLVLLTKAMSAGGGDLILIPVWSAFGLLFLAVSMRYSLVLPAVVLGAPEGLGKLAGWAWAVTKGSSVALVVTVVVFMIAFFVLALLVGLTTMALAGVDASQGFGQVGPVTGAVLILLDHVVSLLSIAGGATILSRAYIGLTAGRRDGTAQEVWR